MCGRYALDLRLPAVRSHVIELGADAPSLWDARPGAMLPIFVPDGLRVARWGWERRFSKRPLINGRWETAREKGTFQAAVKQARCLVPASAYYEWQRDDQDRPREKYAFRPADGGFLCMAGLFEEVTVDGATETRFLVMTRDMVLHRAIHDRTPVVLSMAAARAWVNPFASDDQVTEAAASRTDQDLVVRRVIMGPNKRVPAGPNLLQPLDEPWPWTEPVSAGPGLLASGGDPATVSIWTP